MGKVVLMEPYKTIAKFTWTRGLYGKDTQPVRATDNSGVFRAFV